jgi:hypothetical protein
MLFCVPDCAHEYRWRYHAEGRNCMSRISLVQTERILLLHVIICYEHNPEDFEVLFIYKEKGLLRILFSMMWCCVHLV